MTVILLSSIRQRIWRGYDDPGLPVGMYIGFASLAGDASGGSQRIIFVYKTEGDNVSGRFFNLEQFDLNRAGDAATVSVGLAPQNFDRAGDTPIPEQDYRAQLVENSRSGVTALDYAALPPLPIFLGQLSLTQDDATQLIVNVLNVNNTTLRATIQGYIWEQRSIQAEGGLRRPSDSLYR